MQGTQRPHQNDHERADLLPACFQPNEVCAVLPLCVLEVHVNGNAVIGFAMLCSNYDKPLMTLFIVSYALNYIKPCLVFLYRSFTEEEQNASETVLDDSPTPT